LSSAIENRNSKSEAPEAPIQNPKSKIENLLPRRRYFLFGIRYSPPLSSAIENRKSANSGFVPSRSAMVHQWYQQDRTPGAALRVRYGFVHLTCFQYVDGFQAPSSGSFTGSFRLRPCAFNKLTASFPKNQFLRLISLLFVRL
jgi:hypothetical protein